MHAVIDSLHTFFSSLFNSPYHLGLYIAIAVAAVLLLGLPLIRAILRSRAQDDDSASSATPSQSTLGLASPPVNIKTAPLEFTPAPPSNVTAINEALTVRCIHCDATISTRADFCPACGYAQPVKQSFIAAFPA